MHECPDTVGGVRDRHHIDPLLDVLKKLAKDVCVCLLRTDDVAVLDFWVGSLCDHQHAMRVVVCLKLHEAAQHLPGVVLRSVDDLKVILFVDDGVEHNLLLLVAHG